MSTNIDNITSTSLASFLASLYLKARERTNRDRFKLDLLTNERKMAFCMVYLLYQLQEVIFYDGKTKRTNPDGNP